MASPTTTFTAGPRGRRNIGHAVMRTLRKHGRTTAHRAVIGVVVGCLVWHVPVLVSQFTQAGRQWDHLRWVWVMVAGLCGIGALVVYGEMHRQLLLVGGAHLPIPTVQGINFVENAVSTTIPVVGGAGALGYAITQLRRRDVDTALASWSVFVAGVLAALTLLVLGVLGLGWTGRIPAMLAMVLATLLILWAVGIWELVTHPTVLRRVLRPLFMVMHRIPGLRGPSRSHDAWAMDADLAARRVSARVAVLQPHAFGWVVLITLSALSWLLDFFTLTASTAAVGATVPWAALMVGFLIVQGSIALQILPGGAGLAETGLLGVFLASGVAIGPAAASVLLYRAISWLGLSLLGWVIFAVMARRDPVRRREAAPEAVQNDTTQHEAVVA